MDSELIAAYSSIFGSIATFFFYGCGVVSGAEEA